MSKKRLCIHLSFNVNSCENPWLNTVEQNADAKPFHNKTDQYINLYAGPNACVNNLSASAKKERCANNYNLNFSVSPFLFSQIKKNYPLLYSAIIKAHKASGRENALACCWQTPLNGYMTSEETCLQIIWGLYAFEQNFSHKAQGFYLADGVVTNEILELLCEKNISFAVINKNHVGEISPLNEESRIKPFKTNFNEPFACVWQSETTGKQIIVFAISVAKNEKDIADNNAFAAQAECINPAAAAQAYAANKTGYISFAQLAKEEPSYKIKIVSAKEEKCKTKNHALLNTDFFEVLNYVKEKCNKVFNTEADFFFLDPVNAVRNYITSYTDNREKDLSLYFEWNAKTDLSADNKIKALKLLELKLLCLKMSADVNADANYIAYQLCCADRALEILRELGFSFKAVFKDYISTYKSPHEDFENLKDFFEHKAEPFKADAGRIAAHYALFIKEGQAPEFNFELGFNVQNSANQQLSVNCEAMFLELTNKITGQYYAFACIIIFDGFQTQCALKPVPDAKEYKALLKHIKSLMKNDILQISALEENGFKLYGLQSVLQEYQNAVIGNEKTAAQIAKRKFIRQIKNGLQEGTLWSQNTLDALRALLSLEQKDIPFIYELRHLLIVRFTLAMEIKSAQKLREIIQWITFFETTCNIALDWQLRLVLDDFYLDDKELNKTDFNTELEFLSSRYGG